MRYAVEHIFKFLLLAAIADCHADGMWGHLEFSSKMFPLHAEFGVAFRSRLLMIASMWDSLMHLISNNGIQP